MYKGASVICTITALAYRKKKKCSCDIFNTWGESYNATMSFTDFEGELASLVKELLVVSEGRTDSSRLTGSCDAAAASEKSAFKTANSAITSERLVSKYSSGSSA